MLGLGLGLALALGLWLGFELSSPIVLELVLSLAWLSSPLVLVPPACTTYIFHVNLFRLPQTTVLVAIVEIDLL